MQIRKESNRIVRKLENDRELEKRQKKLLHKKKANAGITLIALVVTLVVLLILAGISITVLFGDSGIMKTAQEAGEKWNEAMKNEQEALGELVNMLNKEYSSGGTIVNPPEPPKEEIEETEAFSRANGVIEIVWLNMDNTIRTQSEGPLSPKGHLGNLTAVKYDGTNWTRADEDNKKNADGQNDWYNYVAQTGTNDEKTSNWANAVANYEGEEEEKAYFVWIPRYAYRITYFDTPDNANAYRADSNSKKGMIGYSNINGLIDVASETEKLVRGSQPSNVTGTVKTNQYSDYIPHPAFEFDGAKAGIWVGKFESSGSESKVTIIPNTASLRNMSVSNIFTVCQGVKATYSLTGDSHMMKNTEWGACAYLAESKYGRNGTEITINSNRYCYTGGGTGDVYKTTNAVQSTTGNIYGIYDMKGGSYEYVAGYIDNSDVVSNNHNTNLINAVKTNPKYADVYPITTDNQADNYSNSKGIKGDAVFETSTAGSNSTSWYSGYSSFPRTSSPVFPRGRLLQL